MIFQVAPHIKLLLPVLSLCSLLTTQDINLSGIILDIKSGAPLEGVEVSLIAQQLKDTTDELERQLSSLSQVSSKSLKEQGILHYNLGVFYTKDGNYQKAIEEFNEVISLDPSDADAHYNLGVIYAEHVPDEIKAKEHFQRYLEMAPNDKDADKARKYLLVWESIQGD